MPTVVGICRQITSKQKDLHIVTRKETPTRKHQQLAHICFRKMPICLGYWELPESLCMDSRNKQISGHCRSQKLGTCQSTNYMHWNETLGQHISKQQCVRYVVELSTLVSDSNVAYK